MDSVIAARFEPPKWMAGQIERSALLAQLGKALTKRLTIVQAPAGYGKTSILSQLRSRLEGEQQQVAWLTLEHDDCDLARLADHLAVLLTGQRAVKRSTRRNAEYPASAALSYIIRSLQNDQAPKVIILDDLHRATGSDVARFLGDLVRLSPPNCHFIVASREKPLLGQTVFAAEGQLLELGPSELRFSADEALALMGGGDDPAKQQAIQDILERTEGWPIAIKLAALTVDLQQGGIGDFHGTGTDLARYLSEQVLIALPPDLQDIVLRTSLPETVDGELVNLLCNCKNGWLQLEQLEQQGVFLSPVDARRKNYRYHQLFAEFLRTRFQRTDPTGFAQLQGALSDWYQQAGQTSQALSHAIAAGENDRIVKIIEAEGGWRLIPQGFQHVLERAIQALPNRIIAAKPKTALARVYLVMKQGDLARARTLFEQACAVVQHDEISAELRTEFRVVGDTLSDYENRPVTFEDLIEREALIRKIPANDHLVLANIRETLGAKYLEGGWLERALQPILAAREHYLTADSLYSEMFTRFLEARIKRAQGRSKEALAILQDAARDIAANFGDNSDLAANCAAFLAELLYEEDRLPEARELLEWCVPHMEQSDGWVDVYHAGYATYAHILASEARFDDAWAMLGRARRVAASRGLHQLSLLADICECDLRLLFGESAADVAARADDFQINEMADSMHDRSPCFRPASVAAMFLRIKLDLARSRADQAATDIATMLNWAMEHGAGRLLVDINILSAYHHHLRGNGHDSEMAFDEAVSISMFQDLRCPFIDNRRFAQPCLDRLLAKPIEMDRIRNQFVKNIGRAINATRNTITVQGLFNEAEAEVLQYLSKGHSNKEIARVIGMSPDTVKYRLKSVFKKLGVNKRRDAIRVAAERGLLEY